MMSRRLGVVGVAAIICLTFWTDLSACGDKFMRVGRSSSGRRYAALHPSSILIYRPAGATTKGMTDLEKLLKQAGHAPRVLQRDEGVEPVLASAHFALLIADYADVEMLKGHLAAAPSAPAILPILAKSNKGVEAQIRSEFHCLIKPQVMEPNDALAEIDHALDVRLKALKHDTH
jgi:hypothetical protein